MNYPRPRPRPLPPFPPFPRPFPRPFPPNPRPFPPCPRPRPAAPSDAKRFLNAAARFESPPRASVFAALRASRARSSSARARSSADSESGSSLNAFRSSWLRLICASSAGAPHVAFLGRFGAAPSTGSAPRLAARRASAAADRGARVDAGAGGAGCSAGAVAGAGAGAVAAAGAGTGSGVVARLRRAARRSIAAGDRFSAFWSANFSCSEIFGAVGAGAAGAGAAGAGALGAGAGAMVARLAARRPSAAADRLRSIFAVRVFSRKLLAIDNYCRADLRSPRQTGDSGHKASTSDH